MKTYTAYFHTDAEYAMHEFKAETPDQALVLARQLYDDDPLALMFAPYDSNMLVNEIEVRGPDGARLAKWRDEDFSIRLAARDLLAALTRALAALNTAPRFGVPSLDTDSYAIAAECGKAIAQAKGGVA